MFILLSWAPVGSLVNGWYVSQSSRSACTLMWYSLRSITTVDLPFSAGRMIASLSLASSLTAFISLGRVFLGSNCAQLRVPITLIVGPGSQVLINLGLCDSCLNHNVCHGDAFMGAGKVQTLHQSRHRCISKLLGQQIGNTAIILLLGGVLLC